MKRDSLPPILLDGPMGSEIDRRGGDTTLPLWSARALIKNPELVREIHLSYLEAGADVITTNTFRTQERTMALAGYPGHGEKLTKLAVQIAKDAIKEYQDQASNTTSKLVAGSISPLEDCYSPELVPGDDILLEEHAKMALWLFESGVDVFLVETINTIREMEIIVKLLAKYDLPIWISFVCDDTGNLLSGESWSEVFDLFKSRVKLMMVNCTSIEGTKNTIKEFKNHKIENWGIYPNFGVVDDVTGWASGTIETSYVETIKEWIDLQPDLVGTCCGATPSETKILREKIDLNLKIK